MNFFNNFKSKLEEIIKSLSSRRYFMDRKENQKYTDDDKVSELSYEWIMELYAKNMGRDPDPLIDPHLMNTYEWLMKLYPESSFCLQLGAQLHDIDRGIDEYCSYNGNQPYSERKKTHSHRSAEIVRAKFKEWNAHPSLIHKVCSLIEYHDRDVVPTMQAWKKDLARLRDADTASFLEVNFTKYMEQNEFGHVKQNFVYRINKLSDEAKRNIDVKKLIKKRTIELKEAEAKIIEEIKKQYLK